MTRLSIAVGPAKYSIGTQDEMEYLAGHGNPASACKHRITGNFMKQVGDRNLKKCYYIFCVPYTTGHLTRFTR